MKITRPFHFSSGKLIADVTTDADWQVVVGAFAHAMDEQSLLRAALINPEASEPSFGFGVEFTGPATLEDYVQGRTAQFEKQPVFQLPSPQPNLKLQAQPTPWSCVQTCLAMAMAVPVADVVKVYGDKAMNCVSLWHAIQECRIEANQFVFSPMIVSGWYFVAAPSLNKGGMMHQLLVHLDADFGCSGLTVLDPMALVDGEKAYAKDGSNLRSWSPPILFIPGGSLPTRTNYCP